MAQAGARTTPTPLFWKPKSVKAPSGNATHFLFPVAVRQRGRSLWARPGALTASPPSGSQTGWPLVEHSTLPWAGAAVLGASDEQPSLLARHRSGPERRWVKAPGASALGSFVDRRYSGCSVDCCRNVFSVGQPSMKLMRTLSPGFSHRRGVITDPFLASWDVRLGVEPVISG